MGTVEAVSGESVDSVGMPFRGDDTVSARDVETLVSSMQCHSVAHRVEALEPGLDGLVTVLEVGEVHVAWVRYGGAARVTAQPTRDRVCWTIPLGPMRVDIGVKRFGVLDGGFALSPEASTAMVPDPYRGAVVLTTSQSRLDEQFRRFSGRTDAPSVRVEPGVTASRGLVDRAWRYVTQVRRASPDTPAMTRLLEETLLTALLTDLPGPASAALADVGAPRLAAEAHASRAVAWVTRHYGEQIEVSDWAAAVGLSVRHLQKVMRDVYGCGPVQYLQHLRLHEAHHLLRHPHPELTVTGVARACGFTHLGRFAAAYRALFGVTPSTTLATGRARPRLGQGPGATLDDCRTPPPPT